MKICAYEDIFFIIFKAEFLFISEGDDAHDSGAFDGGGNFSLVLAAKSGTFARDNFAIGRGELLEDLQVFPIHFFDAIFAKVATFFFSGC